MKIGRFEQLTAHVKNELKAIEAHIESWKWGEIQKRDTEIGWLKALLKERDVEIERLESLLKETKDGNV